MKIEQNQAHTQITLTHCDIVSMDAARIARSIIGCSTLLSTSVRLDLDCTPHFDTGIPDESLVSKIGAIGLLLPHLALYSTDRQTLMLFFTCCSKATTSEWSEDKRGVIVQIPESDSSEYAWWLTVPLLRDLSLYKLLDVDVWAIVKDILKLQRLFVRGAVIDLPT